MRADIQHRATTLYPRSSSMSGNDTHTIWQAVIRSSANAAREGLSVRDVVRLGTCCSGAQGCLEALLHDPVYWIRAAMASGPPAAVAAVTARLQQLGWQPSSQQLEDIARTPISMQAHAEALVTAGVCPTYAQLYAAAAEGVRGVRLWAAACFAAGLATLPEGMPVAVAVMCCDIQQQDPHWPTIVAADICLFALDCKRVSRQQLRRLASELTAQQLQRVLLAAIRRQLNTTAWELYSQPVALQLTRQQLTDLVWESCLHMPSRVLPDRVLSEGALDAAAVTDLVDRATQQWQQRSAQGVQKGPATLLWQLLALPAAAGLSAGQLAAAMVAGWQPGCRTAVCRMTAAAALSAGQLLPLLRSAVELGWFPQTEYLLQLPGAQQLTPDQVHNLVQLAAAAGGIGFEDIIRLPAAGTLTGDQLLPALTSLVQQGQLVEVKRLCRLPGVQQLTADQVLGLLHLTPKTRYSLPGMLAVLQLPAAAALTGEQLQPLLGKTWDPATAQELCLLCIASGCDAVREAGAHRLAQSGVPRGQQLTCPLDRLPRLAAGLATLLSSNNDDVVACAARMLWCGASAPNADKEWVGARPGLLEGLVGLMGRAVDSSSNMLIYLQQVAAKILGTLLQDCAPNQQRIADTPGALQALANLLDSSSQEVVQQAAAALVSVTTGPAGCAEQVLATPAALTRLTAVLQGAHNQEAQWSAAACIYHLALKAPAQRGQMAAQPGLLEGLGSLMCCCSNPSLQDTAARAWSRLVNIHAAKQQLDADAASVVQALVAMLDSSDNKVQQQAAVTLASAVKGSATVSQLLFDTPHALDRLTALAAGSSNPDTQSAAVACIGNIARQLPAQREHIGAWPGLLKGLISLLGSDSSSKLQGRAATAMGSLALKCPPNQQLILDTPGGLEDLVALVGSNWDCLGTPHHTLSHQASDAVINITSGSTNDPQRMPGSPAVLVRLVALLQDKSDPRMQYAAAECISTIGSHGCSLMSERIAADPGALEGLLALLSSSSSALQIAAANAISGLTERCAPNRQRFAEAPGLLQALVAMLDSSDGKVQGRATFALFKITEGPPDCAQRLLDVPGTLTRLVALLNGSSIGDAEWGAAVCIGNIAASDPVLQERIGAEPGLLQGLVSLMDRLGDSSVDCGLQFFPVEALSKLADSCPANQQRIADTPGALEGLVDVLVNGDDDSAQVHAALIVASITVCAPPCCQRVLDTPDALPHLAALLNTSSSTEHTAATIAAAASALGQLSRHHPAARARVNQEPGVVGGLVALLSSSRSTAEGQQHAAAALASLAADSPDTSQQILSSSTSVLTHLSGLLSSSEEAVRAAAESLARHLLRHLVAPGGQAAAVVVPAGGVESRDADLVAGLQALASSGCGEVQRLAQQVLAGLGLPEEGQGGGIVQ